MDVYKYNAIKVPDSAIEQTDSEQETTIMEVQYIAKQKYALNLGKKIVYKVSCITK